jgi:16S rRNA (guanine966-N2)-methyltransferase
MSQRQRIAAPPGQVRIIGGSLRGSRLAVADAPGLRPTPQRLRQTLFDWLAPVIDGARVLDAFAGTGALGIEALSRGAREAVLLERDRIRADAIAGDLLRLQQTAGQVLCVDTLVALATPPAERFDVVFLDPPFDAGAWTRAAALLDANRWLAPAAWVYVESRLNDSWDVPARWRIHRQREAGAVRGTLLRADESLNL